MDDGGEFPRTREVLSTTTPVQSLTFEDAVHIYREPILRYLDQMVGDINAADDLAQETFFGAWNAWARLRPNSNIRAWLYRIATNAALDWLRNRRPHIPLPPDGATYQEPADLSAARQFDLVEEHIDWSRSAVRKALERLPPIMRASVVLHHVEKYTYEEVANLLQRPETSVKQDIYRGIARLRELLLVQPIDTDRDRGSAPKRGRQKKGGQSDANLP